MDTVKGDSGALWQSNLGAVGSAGLGNHYKRIRNSSEFTEAATKAGLKVNTSDYDKGGDWIKFEGQLCGQEVSGIFNTVSGWVIGKAGGEDFSSDTTKDGTPWFDALMAICYTNEPDPVAAA
ncbi:hypothetical protein ACMHYO_11945 [Allopusillimonas ginsengisoli]|uniref:hypothetical protein n=1 Tax=Allopusillimonas ginsengisoli TaxID=453575 RepID=UPI0039C2F6CE